MLHRKPRRFRRRPNGRNGMNHNNSGRIRPNQFSNMQSRGNYRSQLSAEKSFEKYTSLAKEAMSVGDKTLSENYLQHADHFMRVIEDKNKSRNLIKSNTVDQTTAENKSLSESTSINQNKETENKT
tara:strand:- start:12 stop:389 length:378 start_codon:yes stop_codon:yes gene_type:complete